MALEALRVMHPLLQAEEGGASPTSALQLRIDRVEFDKAMELNQRWHSRLPHLGLGAVKNANKRFTCYAACFDGLIYAVAIWSAPVSRALPLNWLELRRLAIAPDAPRNTASRKLAIMTRLIRKEKPSIDRLISYQDCDVHTGTIYRAAGWERVSVSKGGEWDTPTRRRPKVQSSARKVRWERKLRDAHGSV